MKMKSADNTSWWKEYLLTPVSRLIQNPAKTISQYIKPGMKVVDYGSGKGFFSLPMAKAVGRAGKVYCFDVQVKMLEKLIKKAVNSGLENIIEPRLVTNDDQLVFNALKEMFEFALVNSAAYKAQEKNQLFSNISSIVKPQGKLLLSEPRDNVSYDNFMESVSYAEKNGFVKAGSLEENNYYSMLLMKA